MINLDELAKSFDTVEVPEKYKIIWKEVSMLVQINKARTSGLSEVEMRDCFRGLIKRPYFLCNLAKRFGSENILEVGTAEGLQFFSFAEHIKEHGGHVWSCDLRDVRNYNYREKHKEQTSFCLGNSEILAKQVLEQGKKIDFFYIDGSHQEGAVLRDVENLRVIQSENPIWVFDDFDKRFGCYKDMRVLCEHNKNFAVYRVGDAASGNPNHQIIFSGRL
tara:strand:- start:940 stop:1596 length:657 start_codon:yes stop_codon:yes gene_type:complete